MGSGYIAVKSFMKNTNRRVLINSFLVRLFEPTYLEFSKKLLCYGQNTFLVMLVLTLNYKGNVRIIMLCTRYPVRTLKIYSAVFIMTGIK